MVRATTISPWVEIGLRFIGLWPDSAYPDLYWTSYMTFLTVVQYYQYSYVVAHFDARDLSLLMDCLGLSLANSLAMLKLIMLRWNRRIFHYILSAINKDWKEGINCDFSRFTMMIAARKARRCSYLLIGIHAMAGFSLSVGAYIFHATSTDVRELPVKMDFSFDFTKSPLFECILIGQFLCILTIASIVGMINALLSCLYHQYAYIFTHFDLNNLSLLIDSLGVTLANTLTFLKLFALWWNRRIFCCILMTIDSDWKDCVSNSYGLSMTKLADLSRRCANVLIGSHVIAGFFLSVVFYVVRLVKYADNEISREFPVKMEFSFDVKESPIYEFIVIGQIIYEMSLATIVGMVNALLSTLVLHVGGQIDIMNQALMQMSIDYASKPKSISDAVYESLWYDMSPSDSRVLLFIMVRSQKRLTITAGKVADLTLEGFTNYSYVYTHLDFNNLTKLMDGLGLTLDYTLTILKLLCLWPNRRIFADILAAMDDDWKDCSSELQECVMTDKANLAHRCSNVMMSINAVATVLYFVDSQVRHRMISKDGQHREFPVQVQLPFEVQESPTFEFVLLGLFFHVLETATVIAMLNALILTLSLGINMESKSGILIQFIIPYFAVTIEAFVFCFAGEYLSTKSRSIGDAAYEAVWYDLSPSECRILLFMILRSQKRLTISAGKVMDLSLEGFTSVMKASASYISVLHAMY
ncbi:uncharacterized protein LOC116843478 [Odontomachus brunneus]|uniref:uncharacterized protein LOC116843478 n=1 Tax=Odontomachus brunneus TaxID=486640 RepID=UPI0013F1BADB|nr:uncharacterized protein LOC116843478 [Odontomachus brunneus]